MSIYTKKGYKNRAQYINALAIEYDLPGYVVSMLADMQGPDEDFDGLVCALEDAGGLFDE